MEDPHPAQYEVLQDMRRFRGKNIAIVDDALGTGESAAGLRRALAPHGLTDAKVVVLGTNNPYLARDSDLRRLSQKLAKSLQLDYNTVRPQVDAYFTGSYARLITRLESAIGKPEVAKKLYGHLRCKD